jgi:hypothetical protein
MRERLARVLGSDLASLEEVRGRGYTAARRYRAELADGRRVFAKLAVEELTAGWLREEHLVYSQVSAAFIPELVAWDDDGVAPLLVLPDLGDAFDAPPWTESRIAAVREALDALAATLPPDGLPGGDRFGLADRWDSVLAEPQEFLSLGLCSPAWLDAHGAALSDASHAAEFTGTTFAHLDVRGDNIAFVGGRAVLVDWNWAARAAPGLDRAGWAPSVAAEGGPPPDEIAPKAEPGFAAALAGIWAGAAGKPPPPTADPSVRAKQLELLQVALPWASRLLGLPQPDGG